MELKKDIWSQADFEEFRNYLLSLHDQAYYEFNSALIPGEQRSIGIRMPMLREMGKEIQKGNIISFLDIDCYYDEEKIVKGIVISFLKDFKVVIKYLENFVHEISNWAICDVTILSYKIFLKHQDEGLIFIEKLLISNQEFVIRAGIVLLLGFYLKGNYIDYVIEKAAQVKFEGYYVKMAVAWLASVCFVKFPEKTIFIFDGRLDRFTHNKAISKICDSYRVTKLAKEDIKLLRIKR
jgi:3-methyladenine DNA glycosylase AlkD